MINEVSLVVLALSPETPSGFSVAVELSEDGPTLPTAVVEGEEELLDTAVRIAWDICGLDIDSDCRFMSLPVRDEVARKDERTICFPYLVLLDSMSESTEWVDITQPDFHDHKKIIRSGYSLLRSSLSKCPIALDLLNRPFTVQEYRRLCEQILNDGSIQTMVYLHPSNFRRKFERIAGSDLCFVPNGGSKAGRGGQVNTYVRTGRCPLTPFSSEMFDIPPA